MRAQLLVESLMAMAVLACASVDAHAQTDRLIAGPLGTVGQLYFLAGPTPDSTKVIFFVASVPEERLDLTLMRGEEVIHRFRMRPGDFQQTVSLAPGTYRLEHGHFVHPVVVPRVGHTSLGTPIPMSHGGILPRATAFIDIDTTIDVYLEAYGASPVPLTLSTPSWRATVALERHGDVSSDTIHIPLSRLGPGETTLVFARGADSVTTPMFVGCSFMSTPSFVARVREANRRFSEAGTPGWETDRGSAYVRLGDPDQVFVKPGIEIWVYTRYFGRLKFDHRRLMPESREMLSTLLMRARSVR